MICIGAGRPRLSVFIIGILSNGSYLGDRPARWPSSPSSCSVWRVGWGTRSPRSRFEPEVLPAPEVLTTEPQPARDQHVRRRAPPSPGPLRAHRSAHVPRQHVLRRPGDLRGLPRARVEGAPGTTSTSLPARRCPSSKRDIPLHEIPERQRLRPAEHAGHLRPEEAVLAPQADEPLGARRFAVRRVPRDADVRHPAHAALEASSRSKYGFDVVFDNQTLCRGACSASRRWGRRSSRSSTIRSTSIARPTTPSTRRLIKKVKRTLYFPLFMQEQVAPRLSTASSRSARRPRYEIERYFGIPQKNVPVVYNGTDSELFRAACRTSRRRPIMLFVGRTEDRKKGIGTMLEALSLLPDHDHAENRRRPHPRGRPRAAPASNQLRASHDRVKIVDRMLSGAEELVDQYSTAKRVAIVPSFFEGFGFPASEAMSCGLRSDRECRRRAAGSRRHRRTQRGGSCRSATSSAMADAMADVLDAPRAKTARMGKAAARARVQSIFQWKDAAARISSTSSRTRSVLLTVDLERLDVQPGPAALARRGLRGKDATASACLEPRRAHRRASTSTSSRCGLLRSRLRKEAARSSDSLGEMSEGQTRSACPSPTRPSTA